jgi:4-amino-4-deoxychorismate lyase
MAEDRHAEARAMSWVNGLPSDQVASVDRGLQYGDGLFETISCIDGRPRWLEWHLRRLRRGCERLGIGFHDFESLGTEIAARAEGSSRCILKLILTRGSALRRGYRPAGDETPTRILSRHAWPADSAAPSGSMADFPVEVSGVRLGINPQLAGLKHLNRLEQVLAQQQLRGTAREETLMLSSAGDVIGGSMSNLFLADEAGLSTPALEHCGIAGVVRELICAAAVRHGSPVRIRRIEAAELKVAREAFLTNVRWGVRSISELAGRALEERTQAQVARGWIDAARF